MLRLVNYFTRSINFYLSLVLHELKLGLEAIINLIAKLFFSLDTFTHSLILPTDVFILLVTMAS